MSVSNILEGGSTGEPTARVRVFAIRATHAIIDDLKAGALTFNNIVAPSDAKADASAVLQLKSDAGPGEVALLAGPSELVLQHSATTVDATPALLSRWGLADHTVTYVDSVVLGVVNAGPSLGAASAFHIRYSVTRSGGTMTVSAVSTDHAEVGWAGAAVVVATSPGAVRQLVVGSATGGDTVAWNVSAHVYASAPWA